MTYLQFHYLFTLPPLLLLAALAWRARRRGDPLAGDLGSDAFPRDRFALLALLAHLALAFVYTTPWDNYLVYREVWGYPEGRVWFTVGWVPIEEYLFFLLQTGISGLFLFLLARRAPRLTALPAAPPGVAGNGLSLRATGAILLLLAAVLGAVALTTPTGTYLGLIVAWAAPVLALQWAFGGDLILQRWRLALVAIAVPTLYLWIADWVAIRLEIWWISEPLTTGLTLLGLPVEEALFFLATNLMVVFGMSLALHPDAMARARALLAARGDAWRLALVFWGLSMVPAPLLPERFPALAYLSTGLLALGTLLYALRRYGRRALLLFAVAFGFGLVIEWIGSRTGVPFGRYTYTAPGPALAGVPLLVPLGWWAFTLVALAAAPRLGGRWGRWTDPRWTAPLALVAWDLGLDPLMVERGFWRFEGGAYFGVPLSNFVGWYLAGALLVALLLALEPRLAGDRSRDLRAIFLVQAALMAGGLVFFGIAGAAPGALLAMGGIALLWRAERPPERGAAEDGIDESGAPAARTAAPRSRVR